MSHPPLYREVLAHTSREPWPEIDQLLPDAAVGLALSPNWYSGVKEMLDYAAAAIMLPIALPLIALAALATKLTSTGPVFYTQTRAGRHGRRYKIVKIRTMQHNCEVRSGIRWSHNGDTRITPVGKFLRVTHLDELPQLLNVLMGHMSMVGPRPERPEMIQAKGLEFLVPGYQHRLLVKPGVTGLAQVQLPADTDLTSVRYKVVYDLYYVQNKNLLLDFRLLLATVLKAAGVGPRTLRRLFFLPSRGKVTQVFHSNVVVSDSRPLVQLQPA